MKKLIILLFALSIITQTSCFAISSKYNKNPFSYTTHIFIPENSGLFTKGIAKGIRQAEMRSYETKDASVEIFSKNEANSGREMIEQIQDGDTVGYMINMSMIFGETPDEVKNRYNTLI